MTTSRIAQATVFMATLLIGAAQAAEPQLEKGAFDVEIDGRKIHYEVHGEGPVLMTLPNSWGLTHDGLRALYRPLEEHLTMVYFDPRGMGLSGPASEAADRGMTAVRADFDALRRHLGLERVNVIGWSNGAANLAYLAQEKAENLAAAIFVHGGASYTEQDRLEIAEKNPELVQDYMAYLGEMNDPQLDDAERDAKTKLYDIEVLFPRMFADPAAGRRWMREAFRDTGFSWRHSQYAAVDGSGFDVREALPGITVRSLVIAGAHDMTPPEKVKVLADGLPNATYVLFEDSGHFAPVEETEKFVATVLEFLGVGK